jgi:acetyl-CoA C-acetyltransferase
VLVGVGTSGRRTDDPDQLVEPIELIWEAVEAAVRDTGGGRALVERVGMVAVPKGIWGYADPGRLIADRLGVPARTVLAEVGVLQQTLLTRAVEAIASGALDAVVVCGGEAKHRALRAAIAGVAAPETSQHGHIAPDEMLVPEGDILIEAEIVRDLAVPAHQYAIIDRALANVDCLDVEQHRVRLGQLWAGFAAIARDNDDAWDHSAPTAETIVTSSAHNRMVAAPYTKLLCSQWNVDQAGALVVAAAEVAAAAGVPLDRRVFAVGAAESNLMVPLPCRTELHRSPAFAACGEVALDAAGLALDDIAHIDLYSCFPAAVQVQARELGLPLDDPRGLTVTGGMTFAGGPLNNYVIQAMATMTRRLRDDPGSVGLVTSVSGMLTKVGLGLWSTAPAPRGFAAHDVTGQARARTSTRRLDDTFTGKGAVVGSTVIHDKGIPSRAVAIIDGRDTRTIATSTDLETVTALLEQDWTGRPVQVVEPGRFVCLPQRP